MNKDVEVLRESIKVVAQILAESDIEVTQSGAEAYVRADSVTGKPYLINLPYLPDDAPDDLIASIQGYLDHEVGHALFTDFSARKKARALGVSGTYGIVEDTFVEREMHKKFRGTGYNLERLRSFYLNKYVSGELAKNDPAITRSVLIVTAIRAFAGQQTFIDFMADKWDQIEDFKKAVEPLSDDLKKISTSEESVEVAAKIRDALRNKPEEEPEEEPEEGSEKSSKKDKSGESDESGDSDSDEGEGDKSGDDSDEGEDEGDDSDKGEDEGEDSDEDEDEGEDSDEDEGDDSDEDSDEDSGEDSGEDEGSNEEESSDIEADLKAGDGDGGDMSKVITNQAAAIAKTSDYIVFSTEEDVIERLPAELWASEGQAQSFANQVDHMTSPIKKEIERAISAKSVSVWQPGRRSGKINAASLSRLAVGDDRVFRKKTVHDSKDVAASLVIDCSGSMAGREIRVAAQAAYCLSEVLSRIGINHEIVGFTTKHMSPEMVHKIREEQNKYGIMYARGENIYMPVFKAFGEKMTMENKRMMAGATQGGFLRNNIDGESIMIAAKRLLSQPEHGKIMIVLSDGMPSAMANADLNDHLKKTVKEIEKTGVKTVGIGIHTHDVEDFYTKSIYVGDISELPTVVAKQLKAMLIKD